MKILNSKTISTSKSLSKTTSNRLNGHTCDFESSEIDEGVYLENWTIRLGNFEKTTITIKLNTYDDCWSIVSLTGVKLSSAMETTFLTLRNNKMLKWYVLIGLCRYSDFSDKPINRRIPVLAHSPRGAVEVIRRLVEEDRQANNNICILTGSSQYKYVAIIHSNVQDSKHNQCYVSSKT